MKTLTSNFLKVVVGTITFTLAIVFSASGLSAQALSAQLSDKEIPVSEFNALNVTDDFEVTLARGAYGVRLTVDKELAPYVEVYVKAKTLYITYDEKSVPKEIKKIYKGKNGLTPVFRVVAYTPEIQSITLSDNAVFIGVEEFTASQFELSATGKSQVKNLSVSAASAKIALKKGAVAVITAKTDRGVEVSTEGSSNLKLTSSGNEMIVNSEGSSVVVANGPSSSLNVFTAGSSQVSVTTDTGDVSLTMEGSSKVTLSGHAGNLSVKGSRSSSADAYSMPFKEVVADLSGSSNVTVTVSDKVDATLVGGSALYYNGTPEFKIQKIVKSTLAPYGTK